MTGTTVEERTAPQPDQPVDGPVTLMNRFAVAPERDEAFHALWSRTSEYFKARPGFVSLRLHRAVSADAEYRWVNVATWASEADFRAAHSTAEFRDVVTQPGWQEFPSAPMLFEVVTSAG
jgi:heme-degrading monooxygenase HmoA